MFEFSLDVTRGPARAGTLALPHGTIRTPCFMPVGTQGTVRAVLTIGGERCCSACAARVADQPGRYT